MNSEEFFVVWGRPQAMLTLPGAGEDQPRYVVSDFSSYLDPAPRKLKTELRVCIVF